MRTVQLRHPLTGGTCSVQPSTAEVLTRRGWVHDTPKIADPAPALSVGPEVVEAPPEIPSWLGWDRSLPDIGDNSTPLTEEDHHP